MMRGFVWAEEGGVLCQRPVNMFLLSRCVIQKMYKFHFFFVRVSVRTRVPGAGYALANTLRYCVFSHCNIIKNVLYIKPCVLVSSVLFGGR